MRFDVEVTVSEKGDGARSYQVNNSRGYLKDTDAELKDILQYIKSRLIFIASDVLKEEQIKGFDKNPVVLVDGKQGVSVLDVKPLGRIEFISRKSIVDILAFAYKSLLELSRVKTGAYKSHHFVYVNTTRVATDLNSMVSWLRSNPVIKDNDEVTIVNVQPYARKLELLGVTSERQSANVKTRTFKKKGVTKTLSVKKPNGAYQLALRRIKSKYRGNISVYFKFVPGSRLGLTASFKKGKDKKSIGRPYLYPSLFFKVSQGGIT